MNTQTLPSPNSRPTPQPSTIRLSVCIATFNRATFIGDTLRSITSQAPADIEIVVSDNASTDETESVVLRHAATFDRLRYVRQEVNRGLDCNFDQAVQLACGEYCWLMSDDDLLKGGAIERVLQAIERNPSLVLVNISYRNYNMSKVLQGQKFEFDSDRFYGADEMDRLFTDVDDGLWYIGSVIIRKDIWIKRDRQRYYGSLFLHVGVIFQHSLPGETVVIAQPLVDYRMGNANTYSSQSSEIVFSKWPSLVESLPVSDVAKRSVKSAQPWHSLSWLLLLRGWGLYSIREYRRWVHPNVGIGGKKWLSLLIALLPGTAVNALLICYYSMRSNRGREVQWMRRSRFYAPNRSLSGRAAAH